MKFFACFKKMNKLGAAMVEYAVILAFVAAVGSSFTEGFNPAFNNIIKSVSSVLGLAANGTETKQSAKDIAFYAVYECQSFNCCWLSILHCYHYVFVCHKSTSLKLSIFLSLLLHDICDSTCLAHYQD